MNQPRTRCPDATQRLESAFTIPDGSYVSIFPAMRSDGYNHIDYTVTFPTGVGAATRIDARFSELGSGGAVSATIDVEAINLVTGVSPNTQFLPWKDITGFGAPSSVTFRIRTNGARVFAEFQLTGAAVTDAIIDAVRG